MTTNRGPRLFGLKPCIYWGRRAGPGGGRARDYRSIDLRRRPASRPRTIGCRGRRRCGCDANLQEEGRRAMRERSPWQRLERLSRCEGREVAVATTYKLWAECGTDVEALAERLRQEGIAVTDGRPVRIEGRTDVELTFATDATLDVLRRAAEHRPRRSRHGRDARAARPLHGGADVQDLRRSELAGERHLTLSIRLSREAQIQQVATRTGAPESAP